MFGSSSFPVADLSIAISHRTSRKSVRTSLGVLRLIEKLAATSASLERGCLPTKTKNPGCLDWLVFVARVKLNAFGVAHDAGYFPQETGYVPEGLVRRVKYIPFLCSYLPLSGETISYEYSNAACAG
jgi:hypothetical protein